ncbi:hypothetical protein QBE52_02710 [Clostridiaceae bacterium 35-E11]
MIELIVVIAIMAILGIIAIPSFKGYIERVKKKVCNTNCMELEKVYEAYLILEDIDHIEGVFNQYLQEYGDSICPNHGVITYIDEEVRCSAYDVETIEKDIEGESVP